MDEHCYSLLMDDFFRYTGITPPQKRKSAYAVPMGICGVLLIAHQPPGWITLFVKIEEKPAHAGEQWFRDVLAENARLNKITLKPSLGIIENTLVQWAQLPLGHLDVQMLRRWVEHFLETAKTVRSTLIINWNGMEESAIAPPEDMATWRRV